VSLISIEGQGLDAWTPQQAADHVSEAWQDAVESIIETGRRLIEAKQRVGHGRWLDTVVLLPFGERTAQMLMRVAIHEDLVNPKHASYLPASWYTLSVLAQLPAGEIPKRIAAGEITPELDRATAQGWAAMYMAARQETLNAYSDAVDGLTRALSWAKTYTPPAEIPDNYLPAEEFVERIENLHQIAQKWGAA
jgi:Protein of unknown function (DUF3102)